MTHGRLQGATSILKVFFYLSLNNKDQVMVMTMNFLPVSPCVTDDAKF